MGPRHRPDIPGAQSECRESLQTVHLDQKFKVTLVTSVTYKVKLIAWVTMGKQT